MNRLYWVTSTVDALDTASLININGADTKGDGSGISLVVKDGALVIQDGEPVAAYIVQEGGTHNPPEVIEPAVNPGGKTWKLLPGGGGGGLTHFEDDLAEAAPNETVPVASVKAVGTAADIDVALTPKGTGALTAQVADGVAAGGNKRGLHAVDLQGLRTSAASVASGNQSVLLGGSHNTCASEYGAVVGGYLNQILGASNYSVILGGQENKFDTVLHSVICGGLKNTLFGAGLTFGAILCGEGGNNLGSYSTILNGKNNFINTSDNAAILGGSFNEIGSDSPSSVIVSGRNRIYDNCPFSFIGGGQYNYMNGAFGVVVGGSYNYANSDYSAVLGGAFNSAGGSYSSISGGTRASTFYIFGKRAFASGRFGMTVASAQEGRLIHRNETVDATPTLITSDGLAAAYTGAWNDTNVSVLQDNSAHGITVTVTARKSDGLTKRWKIEGAAKRGADAASTVLIGAPVVTVLAEEAGTEAWTVELVANTTRGSAELLVTGEDATTIRWVGLMVTEEVRG